MSEFALSLYLLVDIFVFVRWSRHHSHGKPIWVSLHLYFLDFIFVFVRKWRQDVGLVTRGGRATHSHGFHCWTTSRVRKMPKIGKTPSANTRKHNNTNKWIQIPTKTKRESLTWVPLKKQHAIQYSKHLVHLMTTEASYNLPLYVTCFSCLLRHKCVLWTH